MPETVVHFQIRMPPVLHEQLASWAKEDKASLNALIVGILERAIAQHEAKAPARSDPSRGRERSWAQAGVPNSRFGLESRRASLYL